MITLVSYIIESTICGAALTLAYLVLLRPAAASQANRIFLLFAVLFSAITPLISFDWISSTDEITYVMQLPAATINATTSSLSPLMESDILTNLLQIFALAISLLWLGHFALNSAKLYQKIRHNCVLKSKHYSIVELKSTGSPYSFFKYIFWPIQNSFTQEEADLSLKHERAHVDQFHSLDIVIYELLFTIQWFNPFYWWLGKLMREQHEFLADHTTLARIENPTNYLRLIATMAIGGANYRSIFNPLNQTFMKQRIQMLGRACSRRNQQFRVLALLPVVVVLFLVMACNSKPTEPKAVADQPAPPTEVVAPQVAPENPPKPEADSILAVVENQPKYPGGEKARMVFLSENIKYPAQAKAEGVEGLVYIEFVVEKDGSLSGIKVLRGIGGGCDEEALRVVSKMPNWEPGTQGGKPVRVIFKLPIRYTLS